MLLTVLLLCIGTTVVHGTASLACQKDSIFYNDFCYYFGRGEVTKSDASKACLDKDDFFYQLSQINEYYEGEDNFLKSTLNGMNTTGAVGVWINHKYSSYSGWENGYFDPDDTDWADDPAPAGEGLCQIMSASKEWKWDALDCNSKQDMIYICRGQAFYKDCYESSCYRLKSIDIWHEFKKCEIDEMYLAKIESEDENNFVRQFANEVENKKSFGIYPLVYIDGSDAGAEGTWVFADGEAMPFNDFDSGERNDSGTDGQDCIYMDQDRNYKWIEHTCDVNYASYLCEEPNTNNSTTGNTTNNSSTGKKVGGRSRPGGLGNRRRG